MEPPPSRPGMASPDSPLPTVFISYAWEDDAHREWVHSLASRLHLDNVEVTLDQWTLVPGDQLPVFMEKAVRENSFVLCICTPSYNDKSDSRAGGAGYEGDIMTAEVFLRGNHRKFIPVLRRGTPAEALPGWMEGKVYVNLSGDPYSEAQYKLLVETLHGRNPARPPRRTAAGGPDGAAPTEATAPSQHDDRDSPPSRAAEARPPWAKVAAILTLLGLAHLWSAYHLGVGFAQHGAFAPVVAGTTTLLLLFGWLLPGARETLIARARAVVLRVRPAAIAAVYTGFAALVATCSSVRVTGISNADAGKVRVISEAGSASVRTASFDEGINGVRFALPTTPLGRAYRVEMPAGSRSVRVFPLLGARLDPSADLGGEPSVVILPSPGIRTALASGGRMNVRHAGAAIPVHGDSTVLLGVGAEPPPSLHEQWRGNLARLDPAVQVETLENWRSPRRVPLRKPLRVGETLTVEVTTAAGVMVGREEHRVSAGVQAVIIDYAPQPVDVDTLEVPIKQ